VEFVDKMRALLQSELQFWSPDEAVARKEQMCVGDDDVCILAIVHAGGAEVASSIELIPYQENKNC